MSQFYVLEQNQHHSAMLGWIVGGGFSQITRVARTMEGGFSIKGDISGKEWLGIFNIMGHGFTLQCVFWVGVLFNIKASYSI